MSEVIHVTATDLLRPAASAPAEDAPELKEGRTPPDGPAAEGPPSPVPEGNPFAGQCDSLGREFHPAKFRLKDGKPQIDSAGRFVPAGLGRRTNPDAGPTAPKPAASVIPPDEAPAPGLPPIDQLAADVAINLVQTALILIGQDEGVLTDFERNTLRGPLARILAKYNLGDKMTPELEFAAALAVIVMSRLQKPKTLGWVQGKILAVKNWMTRRKLGQFVPTPSAAPRQPAAGQEAAQEHLDRRT